MPLTTTQRRTLANLAEEGLSAALVIEQTGKRTFNDDVVEPLRSAARRVRYVAQVLRDHLLDRRTRPKQPTGWVLDPRWSTIALAVAADRPPVLLMLAITALRTLRTVYQDALVGRWPTQIRELLEDHITSIDAEVERLADVRDSVTRQEHGYGV